MSLWSDRAKNLRAPSRLSRAQVAGQSSWQHSWGLQSFYVPFYRPGWRCLPMKHKSKHICTDTSHQASAQGEDLSPSQSLSGLLCAPVWGRLSHSWSLDQTVSSAGQRSSTAADLELKELCMDKCCTHQCTEATLWRGVDQNSSTVKQSPHIIAAESWGSHRVCAVPVCTWLNPVISGDWGWVFFPVFFPLSCSSGVDSYRRNDDARIIRRVRRRRRRCTAA